MGGGVSKQWEVLGRQYQELWGGGAACPYLIKLGLYRALHSAKQNFLGQWD